MSDGEKKPGMSDIGDLKARLGKLAQGGPAPSVSVNPFGEAPAPSAPQAPSAPLGHALTPVPSKSANPFGAGQLIGQPSASLTPQLGSNPLGAGPLGGALASPTPSANPFAGASTPSSPPPSANPFASLGGVTNASGDGSANPFAASSNPFGSPAPSVASPAPTPSIGTASENPFNAHGSPEASTGHSTQGATEEAALTEEQRQYQEEAQLLQDMAPLRFTGQPEVAPNEFHNIMDVGIDPSLIKRKLAIMMVGVAAVVTLIIGLLMGTAVSQRRAHNLRVRAWQGIDESLKKPMNDYQKINDLFTKMLAKKEIQWDLINEVPSDLSPVNSSLLATPAPLEQQALVKLSALIHDLNQLFSQVKEHRELSLTLQSELKAFENGKGFEQYRDYAVYADKFFEACIKRGKMKCRAPDPTSLPRGRVVAIASGLKKSKRGKKNTIDIVYRRDQKPQEINASHLILVPKIDVTGFGENVIFAYTLRLSKINERLKKMKKTKAFFDDMIEKKRTMEKIFAL